MSSGTFSFVMAFAVLASVSIVAASEPIVHQVNSIRQSAMTRVRVLLPDRRPGDGESQLPVIDVLPVETVTALAGVIPGPKFRNRICTTSTMSCACFRRLPICRGTPIILRRLNCSGKRICFRTSCRRSNRIIRSSRRAKAGCSSDSANRAGVPGVWSRWRSIAAARHNSAGH